MESRTQSQRFVPSDRARRIVQLLAIAGFSVIVIGIGVSPVRTWTNMLLAGFYLLGIGVSATLFLSLIYVTNAGWAAAVRKIPEALTQNVYAGGIWMLVVLAGVHSIYEWSHADVVASDALLQAKEPWLNVPFFAGRTFIYVALWALLTALIVRTSRRQDATGDAAMTIRNRKLGGLFIVTFALTFWVASMDWIMSLEPHWFSTIFGIYTFSGTFLTGLATVTVVVIFLRRRGWLQHVVREEHIHDLGKLVFAFSTFWMYIWFSQYVLIWYANIPEETVYYLKRETAGWGSLTILNILFNWVIPFVLLLPREAKRKEGLLMRVCMIIMIGHWIDLFWMIMPTIMPGAPSVGIWELGPIFAAAAVAFLMLTRGLRQSPMIPTNDPFMSESLSYHS